MATSDSSTSASKPNQNPNPYRVLPSVQSLLSNERLRAETRLGDDMLSRLIDAELRAVRASISTGARPERVAIEQRVVERVAAFERPRLTPVLNATGIIVHTNLGRAPVSAETAAAMAAAAAHPVALELDPESNDRGGRMSEVSRLLSLLTGAEAALVVNNCAAAVLLALSAIAADRSVIVSRGEAVEIGGGFRIPDVLQQSRARLVEVGTTNRTYLLDYAGAIDDSTAALLKIHRSNFRLEGFVHSVEAAELVGLAVNHDLPMIEDLGSGALIDTQQFGLAAEPLMGASIEAGVSLVLASGDKLIGGPQAGIIIGQARWVERLASHPLARAVRADKTCLAGLAATLRHYVRGEGLDRVPIWRMIASTPNELHRRATAIHARLEADEIDAEVRDSSAAIGGGSVPGEVLPSAAIALTAAGQSADELSVGLRIGGLFGRIDDGRVVLDLRTILPEDDDRLIEAIVAAVRV